MTRKRLKKPISGSGREAKIDRLRENWGKEVELSCGETSYFGLPSGINISGILLLWVFIEL